MKLMPSHVVLDRVELLRFHHRFYRGDILRAGDVQVRRLRQADAGHVHLPVEIRAELVDFRDGHDVVTLGWIAHFDAVHRALRERCFDAHHISSFGCCLFGCVAKQGEHLRHVCDVLLAYRDEALVRIEIVVAIWQREAALTGLCDLLGAVLLVLTDANAEECSATTAVLLCIELSKLLYVCDGSNGFEIRL